MTKQYEYQCPRCGSKRWSKIKPPKEGQWIYKAPVCHIPMQLTGNVREVYSERDLGKLWEKHTEAEEAYNANPCPTTYTALARAKAKAAEAGMKL